MKGKGIRRGEKGHSLKKAATVPSTENPWQEGQKLDTKDTKKKKPVVSKKHLFKKGRKCCWWEGGGGGGALGVITKGDGGLERKGSQTLKCSRTPGKKKKKRTILGGQSLLLGKKGGDRGGGGRRKGGNRGSSAVKNPSFKRNKPSQTSLGKGHPKKGGRRRGEDLSIAI